MVTRLKILDFFDKYGFGDGDPLKSAVARQAAPRVAEAVTEALVELKPEGVEAPVMTWFEVSTLHNSVRAQISWRAGGQEHMWQGEAGFGWINDALSVGQVELDLWTPTFPCYPR